MPELVTIVLAQQAESREIAVSNVGGSNIANLLFVLPLGAMLRPLPLQSVTLRQDLPILLGVTGLFALALYTGQPGPGTGALMLLILGAFTAFQVWGARRESATVRQEYEDASPVNSADAAWRSVAVVVIGLVLLVAGGKAVVDGAVAIARSAGMSERIIGLTIVAVGTSAPEIATTLMAVRRGEADVAIGNAIGSNVFNLLGVAGVVLLLGPIPAGDGLLHLDLPVLVLATVVSGAGWWRDRTLTRPEAAVLLGGYLVYMWVLLRT